MKIRISLRSIPHNELRLSRKSFRKNAKPQNYLGTWLMNVPSNFKHTRHQKSWVFDKLLSQPFPKLINFIELLLRFNRFVIWSCFSNILQVELLFITFCLKQLSVFGIQCVNTGQQNLYQISSKDRKGKKDVRRNKGICIYYQVQHEQYLSG